MDVVEFAKVRGAHAYPAMRLESWCAVHLMHATLLFGGKPLDNGIVWG